MTPRPLIAKRLADCVSVSGRFHRSVHLARDWKAGGARPTGYISNSAVRAVAEQILGEIQRPDGSRAFTLTGPYGAGKSAFALFLTDILARKDPSYPDGRELRRRFLHGTRPLRPILVQAERGPLLPQAWRAIHPKGGKRTPRSGAALARELEAVANASTGGVLLVVDELGKYLEYASETRTEDVFLLQQIAETATRSRKPLVFMGVLHSAFADYATDGAGVRRAEWQKVQGRFHDVAFSPPGEALLELVGNAIDANFHPAAGKKYRNRLGSIASLSGLSPVMNRPGMRRLLGGCLPIHPLAALILWPVFRGKAAQNERSLFAFLTSSEPFGFQEFLERHEATSRNAPLYGVSDLYDYMIQALGPAALSGRDARRWSLMENALHRVPASAPPLAGELVKTIGLLDVYGSTVGLRPARSVLHSLSADGIDAVEESLEILESASIAIFRRHQDAFGLWQGSDLDLDAAFERARSRRPSGPFAARLSQAGEPRPLVARKHYVETGTLRWFEPRVVDCDAASIESAVAKPTEGDGVALFLADETATADSLKKRALAVSRRKDPSGKPIIVIVPDVASGLADALAELERWERLRTDLPELASDPVAASEVDARVEAARTRFESLAGRALGIAGHVLDPSTSAWYFNGDPCDPAGPRGLQELLSRVCGDVYSAAPELHNELLNRNILSAAAARARRVLVERLVRDSATERLGLTGFPPEYSMYESMLASGGFHRKIGGEYRLGPPSKTSTWHPIWKRMEAFLDDARTGLKPLADLLGELAAPPFGLRQGPALILLAVLLRVKGQSVALHEDEVFMADPGIETLERLVRHPETFSVRSFRLTPKEKSVVREVGATIRSVESAPSPPKDLLGIVRELVRLVHDLPPFAQKTRRISEEAREVRQLIQTARDPRALLLQDLPEVFGMNLGSRGGGKEFPSALDAVVKELTTALEQALDEIEEELAAAFGVRVRGWDLRAELTRRAEPLREHAAGNPRLRVFLNELARKVEPNGNDWREGVARAASGGRPPAHWRDEDAEACITALRTLAADCAALSEMVARGGGDAGATIARFAILEPGAPERHAVVAYDGNGRASVADLAARIARAAVRSKVGPRDQIMALAMAGREILDRIDEAEEPAEPKVEVAVGK